MTRILGLFAAAFLGLGCTLPAKAAFTVFPQPSSTYLSSTTLLPITAADFFAQDPLTNGLITITPDIPLVALTVPSTWSSWGSPPNTESSTPRVLWTDGFTSLALTSNSPLGIFGVEVQPNTEVVSSITATFYLDTTQVGQITRNVDGNGGARLFAASSTDPFNRVVIESTDDFAIAQVRVARSAATQVVPVPPTAIFAGLAAVGGFGARLVRRR